MVADQQIGFSSSMPSFQGVIPKAGALTSGPRDLARSQYDPRKILRSA